MAYKVRYYNERVGEWQEKVFTGRCCWTAATLYLSARKSFATEDRQPVLMNEVGKVWDGEAFVWPDGQGALALAD